MFFSSADFLVRLRQCLALIKGKNPVILNVACGFSTSSAAQALLAIGAKPITSQSVDEMREIVEISDAISINIENIDSNFLEVANAAAMTAKQNDKCVILDATAVPISRLRIRCAAILAESTDVICGTAGDILAIHNETCDREIYLSNPDSNSAENNAIISEAGRALSEHNNQVVIVRGAYDLVINEIMTKKIAFGNQDMLQISGVGYMVNVIIAAFNSLASTYKITNFELSTLAIAYFNMCAIQAGKSSESNDPASFRSAFLGAIYSPNWSLIEECANEKWS